MAYKQKGFPEHLGVSPMKQPYDRTFMEVLKNPDPYSSTGGNWSPPASEYVSEYELSGTQGDDKQKKLKKAKKVAKKSGQRVKVDPTTKKAELKTTRLKKAKRIVGHPSVKKTIGKILSKVALPAAVVEGAYTAGMGNPKSAKATDKALKDEAKGEIKGTKKTHVPKY
jgi:hypothetical protein